MTLLRSRIAGLSRLYRHLWLALTTSSLFLFTPVPVFAQEHFSKMIDHADFYAVKPASVECVMEAAKVHQVPSNVLLALASKEFGKNGQVVKNENNSLDLGHFQVNTVQWDIGGALHDTDIKPSDVAWRGCLNAEIAAWILGQRIRDPRRQNFDFWTRAANYHYDVTVSAEINERYKKELISLSVRWGDYLQTQFPTLTVAYK